ncbi:MAG: peptide-methionine (R)-S-oxide reductase MsrB [Gammaproteobacteria bacterium]|nr:peptide-methionine (R)-S-oxide reductase MsrB [Gammaproteobacteria bacterium]
MDRRHFLSAAALFMLVPARVARAAATQGARQASAADIQRRWREFLAPQADIAPDAKPVSIARAEWRTRLPADSYAVLFEEDTEPPLSSPLNLEHRPGVFVCRACRLPLFSSEMKFESGTGWPSFFTSIPAHLATRTDYKLILPRTEYHCVRCGGHQGHVFGDGPEPTGERWCNNGAALAFIPLRATR